MTTKSYFLPSERYEYDFGRCSIANGFAQVDTSSDAHYFGMWANPTSFEIICYCEGDVSEDVADNAAEFVAELRRIKNVYNQSENGFKGIDPGLGPELKQKFEALGLGDMLH